MTPILIDKNDVVKLGLFAVFVTVLVFVGGFFFGFQQAKIYQMVVSEPLYLPMKSSALAVVEQQKPEVADAGEIMDVDQPLAKKPVTKKQSSTKIQSVKASASYVKKAVRLASNSKPTTNNRVKPKIIKITEDVLSKAKYSIQVGMYGRLDNAEIMVGKLKAKDLQAYVTDYVNKKSEVRFNVKFGYFLDKKSANSALVYYKEIQKGDGYLVNFTVNHLTHRTVANSVQNLSKKKAVSSVSVSSNKVKPYNNSVNQDNLGKVRPVPASNIISNTQAEATESNLVKEENKTTYN